ncbi:tetratricopeptide repeat protein [bacterium]|nr:tetratricopeptide repeat protein [bacterium]
MDELSEEERVKQIRDWWSQNWMALVGGLVIGLGGVLGWQGWQAHKQTQAVEASVLYDKLQEAVSSNDLDSANAHQETLVAQYKGTPYAGLGALSVAGAQARAEDYAGAASNLEWATNYADDPALRPVARLRLARAQWAQGEADAAVATLKAGDTPEALAAAYHTLEGDIRLMQGQTDAAKAAYEAALAAAPVQGGAAIQRKLDNLQLVLSAASADEAPEPAADTDGAPATTEGTQ